MHTATTRSKLSSEKAAQQCTILVMLNGYLVPPLSTPANIATITNPSKEQHRKYGTAQYHRRKNNSTTATTTTTHNNTTSVQQQHHKCTSPFSSSYTSRPKLPLSLPNDGTIISATPEQKQ
mmetsp:Transcript_5999/g.10715  ORF Transcript_5999/g.10715 Transcript_5999/m.10715 type:complete len:121 (-) Transcript_5999:347-709(-)